MERSETVKKDPERGSVDDLSAILAVRGGGMIDGVSGDLSIEGLISNFISWSILQRWRAFKASCFSVRVIYASWYQIGQMK